MSRVIYCIVHQQRRIQKRKEKWFNRVRFFTNISYILELFFFPSVSCKTRQSSLKRIFWKAFIEWKYLLKLSQKHRFIAERKKKRSWQLFIGLPWIMDLHHSKVNKRKYKQTNSHLLTLNRSFNKMAFHRSRFFDIDNKFRVRA